MGKMQVNNLYNTIYLGYVLFSGYLPTYLNTQKNNYS